MRHRLYVHLTWTTRERAALVDARIAAFLARYLRNVAVQERARVLALGMVSTHVHVLLRVHPQTSLSRLVQRLKGGSATIAGKEGHCRRGVGLRWARGYNIESVSPRALTIVSDYVETQAQHHPADAIAGWPPTEAPPPAPRRFSDR